MNLPIKYSIIIPCYNEEYYISNILRSIEETNYDPSLFEVLVVLNNCKDHTEKVVLAYKNYSEMNIKVLHEYQAGVSYARNCGANHAEGEYFIFLDADNVVQKGFFNILNEMFYSSSVHGASITTMPDRFSIRGYLFFGLLDLIKTGIKKPFGKGIVHRDVFSKIGGFDTTIELGENVDFLVRAKHAIKKNGKVFDHIHLPIYCSLRRFDEQGYLSIAIPWAIAYLGVKTLKYETFSEITQKNIKKKTLHFRFPLIQYFNSYILYPFLEKRQNRDIRSKVSVLERFDTLSQEQQKEQIKQKLYHICQEASKNVPYYRELFERIDFDPNCILEDIKNIEQIPYLTKDIIREQGNRLLNQKYPRHTLHERKTGGSTGQSTLIYYSQEALDWTAASNLYAISWTGKKRHMREVHFSSFFPETFPFRDRLKEAIKCMALNRTNIATHAFNDSDLIHIIKQIKKAKPYYVEGHPSTMYAVAEYLSKQPLLKKPLFNVFESTGEVLDTKKREAIEKYVGCRVYDRYGNAEFGVVAHETDTSNHALKVIDQMVYPELFNVFQSEQDHMFEIDVLGDLVIGITSRMERIWKQRGDLQKAFPYALTAQQMDFWKWWLGRSKIEYGFTNILPLQLFDTKINFKHKLKVITELVWNLRQDLQYTFPDPTSEVFASWWQKWGIQEYFDIQEDENKAHELVLTTLTNDAMPLIRYRTGDRVENLESREDGYYIGGIVGRIHDMVTIGDKTYPTHYLQDLLDRIGNIVEFQVYNKTPRSIMLHLVVPNEHAREGIIERLRSWWQNDVEVKFVEMEDLHRVGWRDKFRYLIQPPKEDQNV